MEHRLCIIGGGPRATYLLAHMLAAWQARPLAGRLRISVIEPVEFGAGAIYYTRQPDYLRLNTVISQVTAFPDETVVSELPPLRGPSLYEWHQSANSSCEHMAPDSYPSRRDTGRYLAAVFGQLLGHVTPSVTIECRHTAAVDMRKTDEDTWTVHLADGQVLHCDAAVLAIGGAGSAESDSASLASECGLPRSVVSDRFITRPYPVERCLPRLKPREYAGILGLGLTALDVIRACTVGRGGKFLREGGKLKYVPCGEEPHLAAWSKTGLPLMARGVNQKPVDQKVQPKFLTEETVDNLRCRRERTLGTTKLDFVEDLLPLLLLEMREAHNKALASRRAQAHLKNGQSHLNGQARKNTPASEKFDWQKLVCPFTSEVCQDADGFKSFFLDYVRHDIADALHGNLSSPVKSACDSIRDLRDKLRYAVEFGGLTPSSHRIFDADFTPIHNRLAVGPPVEAMEELLALVEAGIVDPFYGPAPKLDCEHGKLTIRPSAFPGRARELSVIVNARLAPTDVATTASPLVRNMLGAGHMVPFENELDGLTYRPGGIAVTDSYRVVNRQGRDQCNLYAIGAVTEGCTWYSQVLARPYVNSRSMRDAATMAQALWDFFAGRATARVDSVSPNARRPHGKKRVQEAAPESTAVSSAPTLR